MKHLYHKSPKISDTRKICCYHPKITRWLYHRVMCPKSADGMANSVDPDQTAPLGAVWSGSTLFAQTCLSENLRKLRYQELGRHKWLNQANPLVYLNHLKSVTINLFFYTNKFPWSRFVSIWTFSCCHRAWLYFELLWPNVKLSGLPLLIKQRIIWSVELESTANVLKIRTVKS